MVKKMAIIKQMAAKMYPMMAQVGIVGFLFCKGKKNIWNVQIIWFKSYVIRRRLIHGRKPWKE